MNAWLKDRKIKAFFSVTQDESFSVGAKNCMNLVGIGKCKVVVFGDNISGDNNTIYPPVKEANLRPS